jgi:hypothetical protein
MLTKVAQLSLLFEQGCPELTVLGLLGVEFEQVISSFQLNSMKYE